MKISEIAKKAKEKLIGVFSDSRREESGQETAKTEPTGQEETVLGINMASGQDVTGISTEGLTKAFETMSERLKEQMLWKFQKMGMTDVQIRKMELWKRYYEEKAKMSNNERRRRGIPMVRRPKRQQYRTKKPDPAAADGRQQEKSEKVV